MFTTYKVIYGDANGELAWDTVADLKKAKVKASRKANRTNMPVMIVEESDGTPVKGEPTIISPDYRSNRNTNQH